MSMELRHLRCFLAIVDEGTITGAARRLHLTQPVVSRTLGQIERHLGVRLIDRSTHHLALTPAGEAFARRAAVALSAADAAFDPEQLRAWPLRLGYAWSALGPHTADLLRQWDSAHPDTPLRLLRFVDVVDALTKGDLDLALIRGDRVPSALHVELVGQEQRYAAVPSDSDLAGRAGLTLGELARETIAITPVSGSTTPQLWPSDARPTEIVSTRDTEDWLATIASGHAVGVTSAATSSLHTFPGVTFVPLTDAPALPVRVAWTDPPPHPAVEDLATLVRAIIGSADPP
ncbi:UNVERIFIED_CONTAM: LysR family transcriptional regulator [Mumia flava]|nr:LysR family transcriptional regulator [Mumia flava]